ncbi:DUF7594 domain-containing protein [Paenibacillus paridis]|uniref:CBM96 family carbohydrate-binding protein n=1 Tax=Paenibacillus paridis TaxID=2583376 RepID=UPI001EE4B83F|nr:DNRLRE domain-containing protein [Paenibacillus paridis]
MPGATLQVIEDSFVRGGTYGSDNYGSQTTLTIKKRDSDASYAREAYLKFNKSTVTGTINSAKIKLYVNSLHSNSTSVPIRAFGINNQAWTESTLKYSNRPTEAGTSQGSDTASAAGSYIYLDVTSFVKNFSGSVISFRIVGLTEDVGAELASKENTTASRRPVLQINGG